MTSLLFFDTDCLSAFLWTNNESLLPKLYPGRMVIPRPVYVELSNPRVIHLKSKIDIMINSKEVTVQDIFSGTNEFDTYYQLTERPTPGNVLIGKGEAASIALAKAKGGVVASNNLRDISRYVKEFSLEVITTGDILVEAYERKIISEVDGDKIWEDMLAKRRRLGANSFTEFLSLHK
ncbi:MAG: hypothetical protein RR911_08080 [Oscillospiraceae bacterium]